MVSSEAKRFLFLGHCLKERKIELMARIINHHQMIEYGWTDEQFRSWWEFDKRNSSKQKCRGISRLMFDCQDGLMKKII